MLAGCLIVMRAGKISIENIKMERNRLIFLNFAAMPFWPLAALEFVATMPAFYR